MSALTPARLVKLLPNGRSQSVPVLFNPEEYSLSRNNNWVSRGIGKDSKALEAEFTRLDPLDLSLILYLDDSLVSAFNGITLESLIDWMIKLTEVPEDAMRAAGPAGNAKLHPPLVRFEWGKLTFQGVITRFDLTCTQFSREGGIRRAEVELSLMQCEAAADDAGSVRTAPGGLSVLQGEDLGLALARKGINPKAYRKLANSLDIPNPLKP